MKQFRQGHGTELLRVDPGLFPGHIGEPVQVLLHELFGHELVLAVLDVEDRRLGRVSAHAQAVLHPQPVVHVDVFGWVVFLQELLVAENAASGLLAGEILLVDHAGDPQSLLQFRLEDLVVGADSGVHHPHG